MYVQDQSSDKMGDHAEPTAKPFSFTFDDGEVNFEDPLGPWFLNKRHIMKFGCI